jgi:hypothetical protein
MNKPIRNKHPLGRRAYRSAKGTVRLSGVRTVEFHVTCVTCIDCLSFVVHILQSKKVCLVYPEIGFLFVIINYSVLQTTGIVETFTRKI